MRGCAHGFRRARGLVTEWAELARTLRTLLAIVRGPPLATVTSPARSQRSAATTLARTGASTMSVGLVLDALSLLVVRRTRQGKGALLALAVARLMLRLWALWRCPSMQGSMLFVKQCMTVSGTNGVDYACILTSAHQEWYSPRWFRGRRGNMRALCLR